ncbi:MAG: adenylosuccinate lyase [Oligoflexia bacterium]|nr:adenylosuccinate lyase [Oligoflexia bacterium]
MIERYTLPQMGSLWTPESRLESMLLVEKAVATAQASLKIIPQAAALSINKKAKFNLKRVLEIEKTTKHDVIAFVTNLAENVGEYGRFVHYGLTSSDVLDTALSVQVQSAEKVLFKELEKLETQFTKLVKKHSKTLCVGRTHGIHAEPTTFGFKIAGFLCEFKRNKKRLELALGNFKRVKLSGAVGTYSSLPQVLEKKVAKILSIKSEDVATQVVPRDRHAELIWALCMLACGYERLAIEIRHLQRTEVDEVEESFSQGQKGSSAMPHKKNPISSENLTGLARLMRSYLNASLENIALWHERDISHSSVERVIFPDAFILAHYMTVKATEILKSLNVKQKNMLANLALTRGRIYSSHLLLALVEKGMKREEAYKVVQSLSHSLSEKENLNLKAKKDKQVSELLNKKQIDDIFSGKRHQKNILEVIQAALKGN